MILIALCALAASPRFARADKSADVLTANHLQAVNGVCVLADETEVIDGMKSLQKDKKKVDDDKRMRKSYDAKISTAKTSLDQYEKEWTSLKDRLAVVTDVSIHNRMVTRMNFLVLKSKEAAAARKDAEDKENAMSVEPETKYVDALLTLGTKADSVGDKYKTLAADSAVKAAIDKATPKLTPGPSKEFAGIVTDLKKLRDEVASEAIPLQEQGGVQMVVVLINGEQHSLVLDPGASFVTLPWEVAEKMKLTVTDEDPIIRFKLADGNIVDGHRISVKNIRVGRFAVENCACVVLSKGLPDPPILLGNSFLSHFIVKIDQKAGQLHMVEVGKDDSAPAAKPSGVDHPAATKLQEK
jgi:predicted aspartyl protease